MGRGCSPLPNMCSLHRCGVLSLLFSKKASSHVTKFHACFGSGRSQGSFLSRTAATHVCASGNHSAEKTKNQQMPPKKRSTLFFDPPDTSTPVSLIISLIDILYGTLGRTILSDRDHGITDAPMFRTRPPLSSPFQNIPPRS
jgi:hypothetical protein